MNENFEQLVQEIKKAEERLVFAFDTFGACDSLTLQYSRYLSGLEKAFEIITGKTYTQYIIEKVRE